ncbi:hypothetical protein SJAV_21450 [Sulfurisphaera javensis]|uniref:Rad50/SbcC-type AAA domain-containing protein n=1 Tax=Sulfurisphaera javensis TaxID=2049879 RepID=A0AAT9GTK2_9CREN
MRIDIKSLGPLHNTTFDFSSPITIIFGKSNSGKSYVLKAIYSSLSFFDESNNINLVFLSEPNIKIDSASEANL